MGAKAYVPVGVKNADFTGASPLGADLSNLSRAASATWTGAEFDDETILDPDIDISVLMYVPEPNAHLALLAGVGALAFLGRPRSVA